jgi:hypothetical protein
MLGTLGCAPYLIWQQISIGVYMPWYMEASDFKYGHGPTARVLFGTIGNRMFFTCSANCSDPAHHHAQSPLSAVDSKNSKSRKPRTAPALKGKVASRVSVAALAKKVVKDRSGKFKVVDIHCHYLNPVVNQKTAHLNPAQYDTSVIFANQLTRETNVKQMRDRTPKLIGIEERIRDMDRMGVDDPRSLIAAVKKLPREQRRQIEGFNAMRLLKIKA